LKKKYPTCKITFACPPHYFPLVGQWEDVLDSIALLPLKINHLYDYDYHVTFEGIIERCKEAEKTNAYKLFSKWLKLDIPDEELIPIQVSSEDNNEKVLTILKDKFNLEYHDYICVQIKASAPVRTPSFDVFREILTPLLMDGHKIVITDRPKLKNDIDKFIGMFQETFRKNIYNFCEYSETILDAISLINYSKLTIAPDSSFVHISAALNVPVFGIYGPFPANIRMSTYKNCDWIEPKDDMDLCVFGGNSCCMHGHLPCPYSNKTGNSPCIENNLDYNSIYEKINRLLKIREKTNA
jgi:ADP-heptose:LPS heptosyltransferase